MSITSAARSIPFSAPPAFTSRANVGNIVMGRLSTQKYPRSSNAFVAADIPEPLSPVMITISGELSSFDFFFDKFEPYKAEV
jgi:hypothetical protein